MIIHPLTTTHPGALSRRATALRRAAVQAAQAPSVLNTQPWKLRIHDRALYVHADHRRQLAALDPQRRVLTTSVGCAVFNARTALAADGYDVIVQRFPNPLIPDLVAVLHLDEQDLDGHDLDGQDLDGRGSSNPVGPVEGEWPGMLDAPLAAEGVQLHVLDEFERGLVFELTGQADEIQNLDPTYRAELDAWAAAGERDRITSPDECLGVLVTDTDTPPDWLHSGEALMRARQLATAAGRDVQPSTQVIEVASARAQLRRVLGLRGCPQMLLRAGHSSRPATRRRLVDVLIEES